MDADLHHDAAAGFLSDGQFGASLFLMSPLYQVFLSGLYLLVGVNLLGVYIVQILLGSISALLLYTISAKLFNRNIALIASVMARGNILLLLPFLVPWFYIHLCDHRKNLLCLVSFLLGVLIALTPFSVLHHRTENLLNPLTSSMGINLYLGNNPEAKGIQHIPSPELHSAQAIFDYAEATAESEMGTDLGPYEVSSFWMKRALNLVVNQPRESLSIREGISSILE